MFIHIPDTRPEYDVKLLSSLPTHSMATQQLDENYNADLLDAWADLAYQQEQAMREEMQPPNQTNEVTNDSLTDSTI